MIDLKKYRYNAIKYKQVANEHDVVMFVAPCNEILEWAGIPRKEEKEGVQTVGYQRIQVTKRIEDISAFLQNTENIIANPILCASRMSNSITFSEIDNNQPSDQIKFGVLQIEIPDFSDLSLKNLIDQTISVLEVRLPNLTELEIEDSEKSSFMMSLEEFQEEDSEYEEEIEEIEDIREIEETESSSLYSETHIEEFYKALKIRSEVLSEIQNHERRKEIGGFSSGFLTDYLKPLTIVDGQHRLLGSIDQLEGLFETNEGQERIIEILQSTEGSDVSEARNQLISENARLFGISLIDNDSWAEHVFQFVVVNQKATPIPRPLLASIISTTLTSEEIQSIQTRLSDANIMVEDYIVLNDINTSSDSPFRNLIKRGYGEVDVHRKLDMTVADRLISIFRFLKQGRPFHEKIDYAKYVKGHLETIFPLVREFNEEDFDSSFDWWKSPQGPWRDAFIEVYSAIKDQFGDVEDREAYNFWGFPRRSNLFNGVQLQIFAADFFHYLWNKKPEISTGDEISDVVRDWLENVLEKGKQYFARHWDISGLRKTDVAVKRTWSSLWYGFRQDPTARLPSTSRYRPT